MPILLANDDGIDAPGLQALKIALEGLDELVVVAPRAEQSAKSHALTMHEPVRVEAIRPNEWAVHGTPVDCVYLGIHRLCGTKPDWIVSGINRGSNLSSDVIYSGTVAAAREGALHDVPSVAFSLHCDFSVAAHEHHWRTAQRVTREILDGLIKKPVPKDLLLNINVPDLPYEAIRGVRVCPFGRRHYAPLAEERKDPRGRTYFWIGGPHERFADIPGSDGVLVSDGWVTVTPLALSAMNLDIFEAIADWIEAT